MIQQGQVFKLTARGAEGDALWAYRYRVAGRGSVRLQVGGFATRVEAQRALQNKLARLGPDGRAAAITLAEWVGEYLQTHTGECVTIAKLRWLLGKATAGLGDVALADLSPEVICAWRLTVPEGHRYEATQALRQVLYRAVAWKLIEENPAKRGVPNPGRRCREQRPFDSWEQIRTVAAALGPAHGPMVLFAVATGLRPSELFALEHGDLDRRAGVVQIRQAYAIGRVKQTKTRLSGRAARTAMFVAVAESAGSAECNLSIVSQNLSQESRLSGGAAVSRICETTNRRTRRRGGGSFSDLITSSVAEMIGRDQFRVQTPRRAWPVCRPRTATVTRSRCG